MQFDHRHIVSPSHRLTRLLNVQAPGVAPGAGGGADSHRGWRREASVPGRGLEWLHCGPHTHRQGARVPGAAPHLLCTCSRAAEEGGKNCEACFSLGHIGKERCFVNSGGPHPHRQGARLPGAAAHLLRPRAGPAEEAKRTPLMPSGPEHRSTVQIGGCSQSHWLHVLPES